MRKGLFLTLAGAAAVLGAAAALTLHASSAATDRYNAAHMRMPVSGTMPGWNCTSTGCVTRALQGTATN